MKKIVFFLLMVMLNLCCLAGSAGAEENKARSLDIQTLKAWLDKSEKVTVIDGSSMLACLDAKIPDSVCLPCDSEKTGSFFSAVPKGNRIIFYASYQPLDQDCSLIREALSAGFQGVYVLDGGLASWRKAGLPVVAEGRMPRVAISAVKTQRLSEWLKSVKNPLVIDIRSTKAFASQHLDGAVNFPLSRLHIQYADIPLDRTLLIVDEDGRSAFLAASFLARKGFLNVQRLQGGMNAYQRGTR